MLPTAQDGFKLVCAAGAHKAARPASTVLVLSVLSGAHVALGACIALVHRHPQSGEPVWFNGVHTNHRSYYDEAEHIDTSDGPPMHTTYADGTAIPDETVAAIRAAYWEHSVALRLRRGDVVVVDNLLAAHGRVGWEPGQPRRVLLSHFSDATW